MVAKVLKVKAVSPKIESAPKSPKAVVGKKTSISMYCVKCKKKQECKSDLVVSRSKPRPGKAKGTPMVQGRCNECSTKMTSFIKEEDMALYK